MRVKSVVLFPPGRPDGPLTLEMKWDRRPVMEATRRCQRERYDPRGEKSSSRPGRAVRINSAGVDPTLFPAKAIKPSDPLPLGRDRCSSDRQRPRQSPCRVLQQPACQRRLQFRFDCYEPGNLRALAACFWTFAVSPGRGIGTNLPGPEVRQLPRSGCPWTMGNPVPGSRTLGKVRKINGLIAGQQFGQTPTRSLKKQPPCKARRPSREACRRGYDTLI
jgi:hypothetical protein